VAAHGARNSLVGLLLAARPRCDCGPHRDAGQMRRAILDLGELPFLMDVSKLNPGPSGEDADVGRSTSRCRITLR